MTVLGTAMAILAMLAGAEAVAANACRIDLPAGFSGAVAIGRGAAPVVAAAGFSDPAGNRPNGTDTRFNLGSVNKMMTAVAVAQLVEAERLGFDDPLGRHLPGLPADVAALSIRDLLAHRAGLALFLRPEIAAAIAAAPDARALVPLVLAEPRQPPGPFRYSNAGFVLLGAVIEQLSGLSYAQYVDRHIQQPSGILRGGMRWQEGDAEGLGGPEAATVSRLPAWPAGSLRLSAPDLWRFGRALASGRLVRSATLDTLASVSPAAPMPDGSPLPPYGLGMAVWGDGAARVIGHSGGAPGVDASIRIDLASGAVAVALQNQSGSATLNAPGLTRSLLDTAVGGQCASAVSASRLPTPVDRSGRQGPTG